MDIQFDYHSFQGTIQASFKSLSLTMSNPQGETASLSLSLQYSDTIRVPSTSVFTGKLNWFEYAKNEMLTAVVPRDVANGEPVILIHQWTIDGADVEKSIHTIKSTFKDVVPSSNGDLSGSFDAENYKYGFTMKKAHNDLVLSMTNPSGDRDPAAPYNLKQTDSRDLHKKKVSALIALFVDAHSSP